MEFWRWEKRKVVASMVSDCDEHHDRVPDEPGHDVTSQYQWTSQYLNK